jgi:hypothetical protein
MSAEQKGHGGHGGHAGAHGIPGGLSISAGGYTLKAEPTVFEAGREEAFRIRILDRAGREVRRAMEVGEEFRRPIEDLDEEARDVLFGGRPRTPGA